MEIILFTGLSASGKTVIARQTAERINLPLIEYHSLMHDQAQLHGFTRIRDWMSQIGNFENTLLEIRNPLMNKIEILRNPKGIIVDQIVDPGTFNFLRGHLLNDKIYIVFVKSNRHDRKHWAKTRDLEHGIDDMILKDNLKMHAGVRDIIQNADLKIINDAPLETVINMLVETLNNNLFNEGFNRGSERQP